MSRPSVQPEREEHEGEFTGRRQHRTGAQGVGAILASRAEQGAHDRGLDRHHHDCGGEQKQKVLAHHREINGHAHAHEEDRKQQPAERLDVGFEFVAVGRFGEHHAGEERAERHGKARRLHGQRGAEDYEQSARGHRFARAGGGERAQERVQQIAAREHDRGNGAGADQRRGRGFGEAAAVIGVERGEQGQERQERHHRHVLEQEHRESALAVSILQLSALFEDLQRDRGGRHGEREAGHGRAAPVEPEGRDRQSAEGERGEKKLPGAEAEYVAPQGEEP